MRNHSLVQTFLAAGMSLLMANYAFADHGHHRHQQYYSETYSGYDNNSYGDFGRVLNARPIYRQVAVEVPRESCRVQAVAREYRSGDSFKGTVIGGLVGAAIGHELGHGHGSATAVGGLIGASIGNDAGSNRTVRYRDQEVCRTNYRTEYEQRIIGYDVDYSYQGRVYQTRTDRHPGDRIVVATRSRDR